MSMHQSRASVCRHQLPMQGVLRSVVVSKEAGQRWRPFWEERVRLEVVVVVVVHLPPSDSWCS